MGEFTCADCGGTFEQEQGWSDADAHAEAEAVFDGMPLDPIVVCDDCYVKLMRGAESGGYAIHDQPAAELAISKAEKAIQRRVTSG